MVMTPEDFKRRLEELHQSVIAPGLAFYAVYKALWPTGQVLGVINRFIGFFGLVRVALHGMMLMQFAKVFDKDSRAIGLTNLLRSAKEDVNRLTPHATRTDLEEMLTQLLKHEKQLEKIKRIKNTRLAHLDSRPYERVPLPKGELDRLVEAIQSVFKQLSYAHDRTGKDASLLEEESGRHTGEILRILREVLK